MEPEDGPESEPGLERLLARNTFRGPPAEWRDAILSKANEPVDDLLGLEAGMLETEPAEHRNGEVRPGTGLPGSVAVVPGGVWERWKSGWTVMAAAWGVVFCLNAYTAPIRRGPSSTRPTWSDRAKAEMRAQRSLLAESSELDARPPGRESRGEAAPSPRPPMSRPRAERRNNNERFMV